MKQKVNGNFLERKPKHNDSIAWTADEKGIVTLEIENKGVFNRIAQKVFKKPKISYVHLDEHGSFIWTKLDGEKDLTEIGELVNERFGAAAHPLYERLAKFCQILESYGFIKTK